MRSVAKPEPDRAVDPVTEAYKAGIDRTLLERNLKLSVEERFEQLAELIRLAEELRAAGRRAAKA